MNTTIILMMVTSNDRFRTGLIARRIAVQKHRYLSLCMRCKATYIRIAGTVIGVYHPDQAGLRAGHLEFKDGHKDWHEGFHKPKGRLKGREA